LKELIYPKNVNKKGTVNIKFFVKRKIRQLFKNFFQAADNALKILLLLKKQKNFISLIMDAGQSVE
jgi:hypothetical protein